MNALGCVLNSARKDIRRAVRDPLGLAMSVAMPFVVTFLVTLIFRGDRPVPRGVLLVVDHDDSALSGLARSAFGQGPLAKMFTVELVSAENGQTRIQRGDASGLLTIPAGFQQAFLKDKPCELQLVTNPAQTFLPGIIKESLALLSDAQFYAQSLLGDQMRKFADRPPNELEVAEMGVMGKRLGDKLGKYLDPPVIALDITAKVEKAASKSIGGLYFPGMLFFGILLVGQSLSSDVWKEKGGGTLRRSLSVGSPFWTFVAGKTLAAGAVYLAIAGSAMLCGTALLGITIARPLAALSWTVLAGVTFHLIMTATNLVSGSERGGNIICSIFIFLFALVGGGLFPFDMMPDWLATIGAWTPNGWASLEFTKLVDGVPVPAQLLKSAGGMVIVAVAALFFVRWRLPRFAMS